MTTRTLPGQYINASTYYQECLPPDYYLLSTLERAKDMQKICKGTRRRWLYPHFAASNTSLRLSYPIATAFAIREASCYTNTQIIGTAHKPEPANNHSRVAMMQVIHAHYYQILEILRGSAAKYFREIIPVTYKCDNPEPKQQVAFDL